MKVDFHQLNSVANDKLKYAVIVAQYQGQWVLAKHKQRDTWEVPGGRREDDELIAQTADRELREETGAITYRMFPVCEYSVASADTSPSYGRLYYAEIAHLGQLPDTEIGEVAFFRELPTALTYPQIQPKLVDKVLQWAHYELSRPETLKALLLNNL